MSTADPLLSKEQLRQMAQMAIRISASDSVSVEMQHQARAVTRIANNTILTSDSGSALTISMITRAGARNTVVFRTNWADESMLRSAVARLDAITREQVGGAEDYFHVPDAPQSYMPVHLWHDSTVQAMGTVNETVVPQLIRDLRAAGFRGSGFVGLMAQRSCVMKKEGLSTYGEQTDSECTVSARTPDGKASGWYGQANRDWTKIQPGDIAAKAIDIAKRSVNAEAIEPGRRTAILSPFAVAQVMHHLSQGFDAYLTNVLHATVFTVTGNLDRNNKIGLRVMDPRLSITSDPADPEGGYFPFGVVWDGDGSGMPTRAMTYVEGGILRDLSYHINYGLDQGKPFTQNPWSMRMSAMPGVPLQTMDEMIAHCDEGIYVHRFGNIEQVNSVTGLQTGVTRDGCFLIKHGKIDRPVKNFRFTDSPMFFLNRLIAIGVPERIALGFTPPSIMPTIMEPPYASDWPRRPMIVPPIMVTDFNFTSLSDAV